MGESRWRLPAALRSPSIKLFCRNEAGSLVYDKAEGVWAKEKERILGFIG
ncbi:hypothetical protein [Pontiella sulfatireligans]|nr:hypothetical protein [Pontiella sulfatireligans]